MFSFGFLTRLQLLNLPKHLTVTDAESHPESFIAERAWNDLKVFTDFGFRITGSHANEVYAFDYLIKQVSKIQTNAHPAQDIRFDLQKVSGSYFLGPRPNVYRNVQNFVVKLEGAGENSLPSNHSLMLNCHTDSAPGR